MIANDPHIWGDWLSTSTTALIFKLTDVGVNKYAPCLKCVTVDYKIRMYCYFRLGAKISMFIK